MRADIPFILNVIFIEGRQGNLKLATLNAFGLSMPNWRDAMKTLALTMALLTSCAGSQETTKSEVAPASSETALPAESSDAGAAPAPTISDSAPSATTPMPPSRVNVVPPVSPDKPAAEAVGTASDTPKAFEATPASAADLTKGATVNDPSGQPVGTIDSTTDDAVVLMVGERRIQVPRNTIGKNEKGLVIGLTKAELEAGADKSPQQ